MKPDPGTRWLWRRLSLLSLGMAVVALGGCNWPASNSAPPIGRYAIVHSPQVERDTVLLDTATGQTWQLITLSDVKGEPSGWIPVPLLNNDKDMAALVAKYGRNDPRSVTSVPPSGAAKVPANNDPYASAYDSKPKPPARNVNPARADGLDLSQFMTPPPSSK